MVKFWIFSSERFRSYKPTKLKNLKIIHVQAKTVNDFMIKLSLKKVLASNIRILKLHLRQFDGGWKYFQIERHQRHKKTTATNNDKCQKIKDKKVQKFQNFSLSCLYLSKFVTVVSHCLSNFLLSFIFDCSFFPRRQFTSHKLAIQKPYTVYSRKIILKKISKPPNIWKKSKKKLILN